MPTVQCAPVTSNFVTKIPGSRKESIELEKKDDADFKVYWDSSGFNIRIGATAIIYKKGRFMFLGHLKFFLGPATKHNTYEAEAAGAIFATWLVRNCPDMIGKRVSLFINNQLAISSVTNPKATSGQHVIRHLNSLANDLACFLGLQWISSHRKVRGNEKVDELAKEATNRRSSARASLPNIFRSPLPTSTSAIKQTYYAKLKTRWEGMWEASDRGR